MTAPSTTIREWLDQAITMRRTGRHPDGRPLGPVLGPCLDLTIVKLAAHLRPQAVPDLRR